MRGSRYADCMKEKEFTRTLQLVNGQIPAVTKKDSLNEISIDDLSTLDFLKKALRHKFIIALCMLLVIGLVLAAHTIKGTRYSRHNTVHFNASSNYSIFSIVHSLVPS